MTAIYNSSSDWIENLILNFLLRLGDDPGHSIYTRLYASLHTSDPTDDTATALATEVTGNNYARVMTSSWSVDSNTGIAKLGSQLNFPTSSAAWGTITDVGMFSEATGGSLVFHAKVDPNTGVYVGANQRFSLLSGTYGTYMGPSGAYSAKTLHYIYYNLLNNSDIGNDGLTLYARLYTTMPSIANIGGVEVAKFWGPGGQGYPTGYAPVQVAGASQWVNPTSGSTYNLNTITLINNAQIDLGYVVGMCFIDTYFPTDQLIFLFPFDQPIRIIQGDSLKFLPGQLKIYAE